MLCDGSESSGNARRKKAQAMADAENAKEMDDADDPDNIDPDFTPADSDSDAGLPGAGDINGPLSVLIYLPH